MMTAQDMANDFFTGAETLMNDERMYFKKGGRVKKGGRAVRKANRSKKK